MSFYITVKVDNKSTQLGAFIVYYGRLFKEYDEYKLQCFLQS